MKRKLLTELDREMVISQIKRLDLKDHYTVDITKRVIRRTISQNHLYWLWIMCISHETGNDKDDLHEYFKNKYIAPSSVNIFGETIDRRTTSDLTTMQFKQLLDHIQAFASIELAITLPNPEDQRWEEFYDYYKDKL